MKRTRITSIAERLTAYREVTPSGCWLWTRAKNNEGYGQTTTAAGRPVLVHRLAYERARGAIPDGLVLDHLCRVRACFNPDHLEAVTNRENVMRSPIALGAINAAKTHCPQGHPYTEANTQVIYPRTRSSVERRCRTCKAAYDRARRAARMAASS